MGDQAPSRATCFIWYRKFGNGEKSLDEAPRIGRPPTQKRRVVIATCEVQPDLSVRNIAARTQTPKSSVHDVFRTSGKVPRLPRVLPHAPSIWDKKRHVEVCSSLLSRRPTFAWIDSIVTMDEKYCSYDNAVRRKHWVDFEELPKL
ncbi:hypothetical protein Y032_0013g2135 [Ancylostoma ceylanicum]|uniref:Mos1 transposase HTH domain-containing protein n=1 Tax=Ancylostoma ceylanicum TaxID=53326 RepID=A0A016VC42_9BILA|nr:hypothetical protein Y032_0013g2135 [Ancylostoma ceylanicum]